MTNATTSTQTSIIILSTNAERFVSQAHGTVGPWVMGALADLFLQGILAAQTTNYFTSQRITSHQGPSLTWLVVGLTILCILKSIQNIANVWEFVVTNFCNPDVASSLDGGEWKHYTHSFLTAVIATVVQSFFVYRYWMLTRRWYLCIVMILGILLSLVGACLVIASLGLSKRRVGSAITNSPSSGTLSPTPLVHFISAILVDVLITVGTTWHLYNQKAGLARSTSDMINRLIRMIWTSALPPTLCVIANTIVLQNRHSGRNTHIGINIVLGKLYAMSLIYTLNVRNEIRSHLDTSNGVSLGPASFSRGVIPQGTPINLVDPPDSFKK
ncbi:hypothetical protein CPB86DRAFT_800117 [Serendipita vermifera]|nr:hypothetical protein CPB86DRAFT_800117 [Serendipita vermifera]